MQVQLAKRLGVPQQYVSRFETGETRMDVAQLWRYCRALGIQFSSFCKRLDRLFAQAR
ncbi:MAG: helix-turn-helix transcriptional regulator [Planctomycetes bacterium]|nr:helix-turn-helix transcriptional regulator [Planctomycetota bacterium]MBI3835211.1 helix-turn-helix transcriptional regulator [Planctomycetota bacterium]